MKTNKATFAVPCYVHLADYFSNIRGVERIKVGNVEESGANPTNRDIGDHGEVIEVEFDPDVLSFRDVVNHFWTQHDPTELYDGQYAPVIFTRGKEQYGEALEIKDVRQKNTGKDIVTQVLPIESFYPPAGYHEKYIDLKRPLHFKTSCRS